MIEDLTTMLLVFGGTYCVAMLVLWVVSRLDRWS